MAINGMTWLVTGGTGFFGRHFTRYLLQYGDPRAIRILSRSESAQAAMAAEITDPRLRFLIGDVRDRDRLVISCRGVDVVIHAAALKRVDTCEREPWEAVVTNIMGTRNVAAACVEATVPRAVLLSTDKAPVPDTLYGATKLVAERAWIQGNVYAAGTGTRFAVTRYGNVLGSTGSVVPVWRRQAKSGPTITMTDPQATRFWMTPTHACELVCTAVSQMQGGETFLPQLKGASLATLAQAVAPDASYHAAGLRPAEKRHEVLLTEEERTRTTASGNVLIMAPVAASWTEAGLRNGGSPVADIPRSDQAPQWTVEELREAVCGLRD